MKDNADGKIGGMNEIEKKDISILSKMKKMEKEITTNIKKKVNKRKEKRKKAKRQKQKEKTFYYFIFMEMT